MEHTSDRCDLHWTVPRCGRETSGNLQDPFSSSICNRNLQVPESRKLRKNREKRKERTGRKKEEYIMRNSKLDETKAGIKIARRNINNLRYADDTTLKAENEEKLRSRLMKVKEESAKADLKLNIKNIRS